MTQVAQIVTRALRLLRVLDANEAAEAMDMQTAILALNALMRRWEANGLRLGWVDVSGPEDVMPTPAAADQAISFNLAVTLRPEYGAPLEPDVVESAANGLNELRRDNSRCGSRPDGAQPDQRGEPTVDRQWRKRRRVCLGYREKEFDAYQCRRLSRRKGTGLHG